MVIEAMARRALITGITGQDGAYLAQLLLAKGYGVYGTFRRLSTPNFWRLQALGIYEQVKLISMDLLDSSSIIEALNISQPDEVYNLAAQSFVGASFDQPIATAEMTGIATTRMLEAQRIVAKEAKFYQASTSELFGNSSDQPRDEDSSFKPRSPYAAAKLYAYWITKIYREGYGIFACNGILFNHESPLRGLEFVTRKITNACAKISLGLQENLVLGNLDAKRDWGFAPDYVESMQLMLAQPTPDDFVIATGETHSVREFVDIAFARVGLDSKDYVITDRHFFRPLDVDSLVGNPTKARTRLDWKHKTKFVELVHHMVDEDLRRWRAWQAGKLLPWDAHLYPDDKNIIISRYTLDR
jgi:GDPmannose 4,6-dehydratase